LQPNSGLLGFLPLGTEGLRQKKTSVNKKMEEEFIHIASNIHHYITSVNFIHMCKKSFKKLNKNKISVTNNSPQTMERMNMPKQV
jgi:hypothetical protein